MDEQLPDSTRMAFLQRVVEGVPDLRRVRILDGVMTVKSGSSTTITYEAYHRLLQDASFHHDKALSEGSRRCQTKAHEVFAEPSQETHDYHPSPQTIPIPQLRKVPWLRHMRYICPTSNPRTTYPGYLSQKSSGRNSPLMTGSSSLSTTRRFLPRLGHCLQVIPELYPILLGFQMVENHEASLAIKGKKKELMNQTTLPMKKHLAKINSCLPWFMKPSMPLTTTHPLILTQFCLSTEPTQEHLRHPISSQRP